MTVTSVKPAARTGSSEGLQRVEGVDKVTGQATYAYEYDAPDAAYVWLVTSTVARGRVTHVDADAVTGRDGVLAVLWHANAIRLGDMEDPVLQVLQDDRVAYRHQIVAAVVAETPEAAREAARVLPVEYAAETHDVVLDVEHPKLHTPEDDTPDIGDPEAAYADSAVRVDATYETPAHHNNPMEPHATTAVWDGDSVTLYDSNQGGHIVRDRIAAGFGLDTSQVRVVSTHVGGGFGAKGVPRPPIVVAVMAAKIVGRACRLTLTRQQLFSLVGYRAPTIQRIRLGAGTDGGLRAISHETSTHCSTITEFVEAASGFSAHMYAAPHRRTAHRVAALDVPYPSWMRAPGEASGAFAVESAMDELAYALELDPIELRVRNEPDGDPSAGVPFSSRNLIGCLREGAERFGWHDRDRTPGVRREGRWLVGTGVAASTFPAITSPASARASVDASGRYTIAINATDIGTGARTAMLRIAAETLGVEPDRVTILIGDTELPRGGFAGGSMGTASWGWAVTKASAELAALLRETPTVPGDGLSVTANTREDVKARKKLSRYAFGAQFVEARVDVDTGEVRVPRMLGVFAAGRIVNPVTARSQFVGGMTMGLSMALHEAGELDSAYGDYANHDFASYHIAANADVGEIDVAWLDEHDPDLNGNGTKGIGEIGIVGTAAAIANAVFHATGVRVRSLPIRTLSTRSAS